MYLLALAETVASTRLEFAEQSKVAGHENSAGLRNGACFVSLVALVSHSLVDSSAFFEQCGISAIQMISFD